MSNTIVIEGNLTRDPTSGVTQTKRSVTNFSVASNRRSGPRADGTTPPDEVLYMDCVAWGYLGQHVMGTLSKGQGVIVTGRLREREWTDKNTGELRKKTECVADTVAVNLRFQEADIRRPDDTEPDNELVSVYAGADAEGEEPF